MELDDFLKPRKVRCVNNENRRYLTKGKLYDVAGATYGRLKICDDNGGISWHDMDFFELVIKSAENPIQNAELTPEFEAVEPKFKVGDKVYYRAYADICVVSDVSDLGEVQIKGWREDYYNSRYFCHANQENYERLQAIFPRIEFEKPPTQADIDNAAVDKLAQAMKDKLAEKREQGYHGWETCKHGDLVQLLINHVDKGDPIDVANFCAFLFARGEPLTEAVLDE